MQRICVFRMPLSGMLNIRATHIKFKKLCIFLIQCLVFVMDTNGGTRLVRRAYHLHVPIALGNKF
jgi:hypothetical protein